MALKPGDIVMLHEDYSEIFPTGTLGWVTRIEPKRLGVKDDLVTFLLPYPVKGTSVTSVTHKECSCYAYRLDKLGEVCQ